MTTEELNEWFLDWQKRMAKAFIDDDAEEEEWLNLELQFKMRASEKPQESLSGGEQYQPTGWDDKDRQEGLET